VYKDGVYVVLDASDGWYKINVRGSTGWISGDYATYTNSTPKDMYQFLILSCSSGVTLEDLNNELKGKGILQRKGQAFMDVGKLYNINEIYLLAHAILETGNGTSTLSKGVLVNTVDGKKVEPKMVYNMFGIDAYDSSPLKGGSEYA